MSKPTGIAPLHGSHVAVPIACDALNAQAVAVREYHYQTGQVMAIKEDKSFTGTQIGYRSLLLETGHDWKRGQAFSMNTDISRSLTGQEIRSWRVCSNGSLSV